MANELEQYIRSYFGVVNTQDLETISGLFKLETIQKGDYFLKKGMPSNRLSFIQSGLLRVFVINDKKEVTQWISTAGYFVTDLSSYIFKTPSRWNIQALTDISLYTINIENYNKIGHLVSGWHQLEKLFIVKCFTMMEDRIFSHLSMTAEERYNLFFEQNSSLFNEVPLHYIASMLGMTPETFSRIRKRQLQ